MDFPLALARICWFGIGLADLHILAWKATWSVWCFSWNWSVFFLLGKAIVVWCSTRIDYWAKYIFIIYTPFGQCNSEIWHELSSLCWWYTIIYFSWAQRSCCNREIVQLSVQNCKVHKLNWMKIKLKKHEQERIEAVLHSLALQSKK